MCKDTKYLIILLLLFILTIPNTHAAKNITYTFRKLDDTRPLLPGFHNQMKKIARGVLKGIPTGMTRVAVFSYKTMNYNPTTNVSRALQIVDYLDIISPNGDMDSEAMNDAIEITSNYFQGVLFFSLFGLIPLLIVIVWIILYWIYGCCRCCFMCCGKSKLVKESKLMQKYYARGDVQSYLKKLKKREGAQCICRAISGLFIFTFVILIIVWIIFAEQTSIEASMIVADGISAVETLENYVEGGFDIANDVIQFTDAFDRIVDKANETFLSKIPNVQKIDSWMQCIDGIVESLPNTTNIKDFLSGVNETVNGLQLNDLIGLIEELEDIVHGVKFKDLQSLYDEVKKVKDVILEIPTSLENINASFTEMNEQKNSLPNMEDLENSLEEIETKLNDLENLDQFIVKLKNFTGHKPKEIANDLMSISATIQDLKESIPGLVESFNQIELVKNSFPSFDNIQEQINGINQTIESINFDSLMEPIKNLSNSMDMVFDVRDRMQEMISSLNETLIDFADFTPLFKEIDKISVIEEKAKCVDDIIDSIKELNNSVLILPDEIMEKLDEVIQMKEDVFNATFIDEIIENTRKVNDTVSNMIPKFQEKMDEINFDDIVENKMPNITEIEDDLEKQRNDFESSKSDLDTESMTNDMTKFKESLSNIPTIDVTSLNSLNESISNLNTSLIDEVVSALNSHPSGDDACSGTCTVPLFGLDEQLEDIDENKDVDVDELKTNIGDTKESIDDFPDLEELMERVDTMRETALDIPGQLDEILNMTQNANSSLDEIPFDDSKETIEDIKNNIADFDIDGQIDNIDQIEIGDSINEMKSQVEPIKEMMNTTFNAIDMAKDTKNQYLQKAFDFTDGIFAYFDKYQEYKHEYIPYIYKYDTIRLWIFLFVILLFIFTPIFLFMGTCFYRKCLCCLMVNTHFMATGAIIGFLILGLLLPLNVFLVDHCPNEYIVTQFDKAVKREPLNEYVTRAQELIDSIASRNLSDIPFDLPLGNLTIRLNITDFAKNLFLCEAEEDPLVSLLNQVESMKDDTVESMDTMIRNMIDDASKSANIKIHPNALNIIDFIKEEFDHINPIISKIKALVECKSLNGFIMTLKGLLCESVNQGVALIWYNLLWLALLGFAGSIWSCGTYYFLHTVWSPSDLDKKRLELEMKTSVITTNNLSLP